MSTPSSNNSSTCTVPRSSLPQRMVVKQALHCSFTTSPPFWAEAASIWKTSMSNPSTVARVMAKHSFSSSPAQPVSASVAEWNGCASIGTNPAQTSTAPWVPPLWTNGPPTASRQRDWKGQRPKTDSRILQHDFRSCSTLMATPTNKARVHCCIRALNVFLREYCFSFKRWYMCHRCS